MRVAIYYRYSYYLIYILTLELQYYKHLLRLFHYCLTSDLVTALLFDKVNQFVRVNDEMSAYRTREIALKEAIMGGYTTGAVVQGLIQYGNANPFKSDDLVVCIFPDHGSRYITKVYSDQWMAEQGFINNCVHNYDEVFKTEFIK